VRAARAAGAILAFAAIAFAFAARRGRGGGAELEPHPPRPGGLSRSLVGDFNGDGSEDVAVPVSPAAGRVEELNDGLANWRIQGARYSWHPLPSRAQPIAP